MAAALAEAAGAAVATSRGRPLGDLEPAPAHLSGGADAPLLPAPPHEVARPLLPALVGDPQRPARGELLDVRGRLEPPLVRQRVADEAFPHAVRRGLAGREVPPLDERPDMLRARETHAGRRDGRDPRHEAVQVV